MTPTADQWRATAVHEASHAAVYCRFGWPFLSVRVYEADGEVLGSVLPPAGRYNPTARAIACLAGPLAESHYTGVGFHELAAAGGRVDVAMARDALSRIGRKDFELLLAPAHALVLAQWPRIERIAAALLRYQELTYTEVLALLR